MSDPAPPPDPASCRRLLERCGIDAGTPGDAEAVARAEAVVAAVREHEGEPQAEAAFDAHMAAEFAEHDLAATMATMSRSRGSTTSP